MSQRQPGWRDDRPLARAHARADEAALVFARGEGDAEALTYGDLDRRARALGGRLRAALPPGALVLLPMRSPMRSDAHSVVAPCACLYASLPGVPVPLPGRNGSARHLRAIADASACAVAAVPPDAAHLAQSLPDAADLARPLEVRFRAAWKASWTAEMGVMLPASSGR